MTVATLVPPGADLRDAVLRPVRDGLAFESAVEQLATSIRLGVFGFGERLPAERDLAERLGVSRMTLREAIAALRQAGMVTTRPGRGGGTVVTYRGVEPGSLPPERVQQAGRRGADLRDALSFRRVVEPGAAYLAAARPLSGDQRAWLSDSLRAVEEAADNAAHRTADSRLHLTLAALCGSPMLVEAVTRAQAALHELLSAIPVLPRNIEHSNRQHRAVVDAVLRGDRAGARARMEEHCDTTSALLRGLLG
ncbi:MAG TPA: FCD domain-containing protein [Dermatophilaceae bacterium]|nr:FCD domain-containing protein [Dermatophilaceae bacterium]